MWASTSASVRPAGRSSGARSRIASGTARSTSSATDATSSAASICSTSTGAGPRWRSANSLLTRGRLPAHERQLRDDRGHLAPAHVDGDRVAVDGVGWQERERDPVSERGREVAAGDLTDDCAGARDRVALARDLASFGGDAPEPAGDPTLALGLERRLAPEVALVEAHHPS